MIKPGPRFFVTAAFFLWSLAAQGEAQAGPVSFGVKGGASLLDAVDLSYGSTDETRRFTFGPAFEVGLPGPFAFEASGLYRRMGYTSVSRSVLSRGGSRVRGNCWEFPLLGKWYFADRSPLRPYVSGGYVLRHVSGLEDHIFGIDIHTGQPYEFDAETRFLLSDNPNHGVAVGGGIRLQHGFLGIAPELRYTHWAGRTFDIQGGQGFFLRSNQNQLDLLVSFTF